ncbi:MAG: hypothetical protein ACE5E0_03060 [Terriglobia bacterium]
MITLDPGDSGWWEDAKGNILVAGKPQTFKARVGDIMYFCSSEQVGRSLTREAYEVNLEDEQADMTRRPELDQYLQG